MAAGIKGAGMDQQWDGDGAQGAGRDPGEVLPAPPAGSADYPGGGGWAAFEGQDEPAAPPPTRRPRIGTLIRLGVVLFVAGGALVGWLGSADRDSDGVIIGAGVLEVDDLAVGDCFDDEEGLSPDGEAALISSIPAVPCEQPHDNEVFHVFTAQGGEVLPLPDQLAQQIGAECLPAFDAYVGTPYEDSELDFFTIEPTEDGWRAGDRDITCALYDLDLVPLEGSARLSNR